MKRAAESGAALPWQRHRWGDIWLIHVPSQSSDNNTITLPATVADRAKRFVHTSDAKRYVQAHQALHSVLAQQYPGRAWASHWRIEAHGKPQLQGGPAINLSRRGDWAAFIIGAPDASLGIDIEPLHEMSDAKALAASHFTAAERVQLEQSPPRELSSAFLRVWTRKEAAVKAAGTGLSLEPSSFHVDSITPLAVCTLEGASQRWQIEVESLHHPLVAMAVARVLTVQPRQPKL